MTTTGNVQQDILETFVDRGQLRKLAEPAVPAGGNRIPGLKLDHPRQLALMHALVPFAHVAAESTFTTRNSTPTSSTRSAVPLPTTAWTSRTGAALPCLRYRLCSSRGSERESTEEGVAAAPIAVTMLL